jgi:parvulin-like peptidyl-prolyl isomerase
MAWRRTRWLMIPLLGWFVCGCVTEHAKLPTSRDTPFVLAAPEPEKRIVRSQQPDKEGARLPSAPDVKGEGPEREGRPRVTVRAWVNGKPIFDEEVVSAMLPQLAGMAGVPRVEQAAYQAKLFNEALDQLIEREMILQDAFKLLSKNPKFLDKMKEMAAKDFDKKVQMMIKNSKTSSMEELKLLLQKQGLSLDSLRRQDERNFIAKEYIGSRIFPLLNKVGHKEIREYYEQHLNEFQTIDRVKWQNIFIAVGPKHATLADARRFAEQIVTRARAGENFNNFLQFDDGDSQKYRDGEGYGQRRGEIKPPEVEPFLFRMKDGELGPLVEMTTGVHVFRLLKREFAGQLPFDDKVQAQISAKLKNEIAAREYKSLVRDLKDRSVIQIEK